MRLPNRNLQTVARATLAACLLVAPCVHAAPLNSDGNVPPIIDRAASLDTPQSREFRAGLQAQLRGDPAAAKTRFKAALKIDPSYAPALVGMASLAQAQGDLKQVEHYLVQAERSSPKTADVHLAWGRHYLGTRQIERAEKSFLKARELAPKSIPPLLELGEVYIRTPGRTDEALRAYRSAVELDGKNMFAQYGMGIAAAAAGQRETAFKALETAAELAPKDPAPHRAIGRLHLEAGALDKALAAFDRGLARVPQFVPLMLDRADVLGRQSRWPDTIAQLTAAEKLAPKSVEVQVKLADVYQASQQWPQAEAGYLKAIELDARYPLAYNNLAWMTVARNGDSKKAVAWASKAVELSPKSSPLHDTLGWAQRASGDLAGAQKSLQRAIDLEPKVAAYHFHLGLVQRDLKQTAAARSSLQHALELDSKLPQADEARRAIKELSAQ